jgi:hypothetical protein
VCIDTISELVDWLAEENLADPNLLKKPPLVVAD